MIAILDIMSVSQLEEGIVACSRLIEECLNACSAAESEYNDLARLITKRQTRSCLADLQVQLRLKAEIKARHAKIGLETQVELLQLIKSTYIIFIYSYIYKD